MQKQIQEILDVIRDYDWSTVELALAILKSEQSDTEAIAGLSEVGLAS
ncbi:MAG: hypothetical protein AAGF24_06710 [Cyanobacteria bacterium P01_H01_bin.121]